jgi:hypothetical protein
VQVSSNVLGFALTDPRQAGIQTTASGHGLSHFGQAEDSRINYLACSFLIKQNAYDVCLLWLLGNIGSKSA